MQFEMLENRRLLSADGAVPLAMTPTVEQSQGVLKIEGTPDDNTLLIERKAGLLVLTLDGKSIKRPLNGVNRIQVRGLAGDDTISLGNVSINSTIFGGKGNDTLTGAFRIDTIEGGPGNDTINGRFGNDIIRGGDGRDRMTGGEGEDSIYGGDGRDRFVSKDGEADRVFGGSGNDRADEEDIDDLDNLVRV